MWTAPAIYRFKIVMCSSGSSRGEGRGRAEERERVRPYNISLDTNDKSILTVNECKRFHARNERTENTINSIWQTTFLLLTNRMVHKIWKWHIGNVVESHFRLQIWKIVRSINKIYLVITLCEGSTEKACRMHQLIWIRCRHRHRRQQRPIERWKARHVHLYHF